MPELRAALQELVKLWETPAVDRTSRHPALWTDAWNAARDALDAPAIPRSPPREPTPEMLANVDRVLDELMAQGKPVGDTEIWQAMYDAAPLLEIDK